MTHLRKLLLPGLLALALACSSGRRPAPALPLSAIETRDRGHEDRLEGFRETTTDWRWTGRRFAVALDSPFPPDSQDAVFLELDGSITSDLAPEARAVTLTALANGIFAGKATYSKADRYLFHCALPAAALRKQPVRLEFDLDKSWMRPGDRREMGMIVVSVRLVGYEQTEEFRRVEAPRVHRAYLKLAAQRHTPITPAQDLELMKLFHELPVWESLRFQDIPIFQNPLDLWVMQQIIGEVRPDFLIETGTSYGGGALFWAYTLDGLGLETSRVLTMDIYDGTQAASTQPLWKKHVDFFHGSSTDPAIVAAVERRVKGRKVIVTLDSDHSMRHVLREMRMYGPMVSRGSYLVVQDTDLDGVPTHPEQFPGPLAAVLQFLKEGGGRDFEQDFSREQVGITFYPGGWLRRK